MKRRRQDWLLIALILVSGGILGGGFLFGAWNDEEVKLTPPAKKAPVVQVAKKANITAQAEPSDKVFDRHFRAGVDLLQAGRYEDASTMFDMARKRNPHIPEVQVNLGFSLLGLKKSKAAEQAFRRGIEMRRDQLNAYYGLAESLEQQGRMEEALGAMQTFIHLTPSEDPFRRRAQSAVWEWRNAKEIEEFKKIAPSQGPSTAPKNKPAQEGAK